MCGAADGTSETQTERSVAVFGPPSRPESGPGRDWRLTHDRCWPAPGPARRPGRGRRVPGGGGSRHRLRGIPRRGIESRPAWVGRGPPLGAGDRPRARRPHLRDHATGTGHRRTGFPPDRPRSRVGPWRWRPATRRAGPSPMLVPSNQEPALRPVSVAVDPVSLADLSPGSRSTSWRPWAAGAPPSVVVVVRGATLLDVAVTSGTNLLAPGGSGGSGQVTIGVGDLWPRSEAVVQASHARGDRLAGRRRALRRRSVRAREARGT
jgi:hypothetical protein